MACAVYTPGRVEIHGLLDLIYIFIYGLRVILHFNSYHLRIFQYFQTDGRGTRHSFCPSILDSE